MLKKRILILNWRCPTNPLSGGAEKVTLEHAKAWVQHGWDVVWLAGSYQGNKGYEVISGVHIYRYGGPVSIYFTAWWFYWTKWNGNFDLVIDEFHGIPFLSPIWAFKSKKLAYIHEVAQEIWDEMYPFPVNLIGKLYENIYFSLYKNTPFLTGADSAKKDLQRYGIPEKNITVLRHGLFLNPVKEIPKKQDNLTLIFVARLVKMKGIEDALRLCAHVKKENPKFSLWIVGDGENDYVKFLKQLTEDLDIKENVIFHGYVTEAKKIRLYQKAHFLVHTSIREGFGLVVIEANSQGTPAAVYNSPGLQDVVEEGINGFKIEKKQFGDFARKITEVYKNEEQYNKLIKSSIESSKKYDWEELTNTSTQYIHKILEK